MLGSGKTWIQRIFCTYSCQQINCGWVLLQGNTVNAVHETGHNLTYAEAYFACHNGSYVHLFWQSYNTVFTNIHEREVVTDSSPVPF